MNFLHKIPIFFFSLIYPCKIHGKENIPKKGNPAVMVCNHFRAIDCGFVARAYGKDMFFLAKKELFKNVLFTKVLKSYGAISVDRDKPDLKSMLASSKVLKEKHKLVIFPEGTRNTENNEIQDIKGGSAFFAVKAKCPIVPMVLSGKAKPFKRTHLMIGKPFELSEFYDIKLTPEITQQMDDVVKSKMIEQQRDLKKLLNKKNKGIDASN